MTITGLVCAIVVGGGVGLLGRLVAPGRPKVPIWLTVATGIGAALAGTIAARLTGVDTSGPNLLAFIVQVGLAGVGVVLVVTSAAGSDST